MTVRDGLYRRYIRLLLFRSPHVQDESRLVLLLCPQLSRSVALATLSLSLLPPPCPISQPQIPAPRPAPPPPLVPKHATVHAPWSATMALTVITQGGVCGHSDTCSASRVHAGSRIYADMTDKGRLIRLITVC